jgi:hypothetical protein
LESPADRSWQSIRHIAHTGKNYAIEGGREMEIRRLEEVDPVVYESVPRYATHGAFLRGLGPAHGAGQRAWKARGSIEWRKGNA